MKTQDIEIPHRHCLNAPVTCDGDCQQMWTCKNTDSWWKISKYCDELILSSNGSQVSPLRFQRMNRKNKRRSRRGCITTRNCKARFSQEDFDRRSGFQYWSLNLKNLKLIHTWPQAWLFLHWIQMWLLLSGTAIRPIVRLHIRLCQKPGWKLTLLWHSKRGVW